MERDANEHPLNDAGTDEAQQQADTTVADQRIAAEVAGLSVAEQIRRQIKNETGAVKDPGIDLHLSMRGGGVELTDEAHEAKAASGKDFVPPPFQESEWKMPVLAVEDGDSSGLTRWLIIGGLAVLLIVAAVMYGLPALREYSTHKAESTKATELGETVTLDAVLLDEAFYSTLDTALKAANGAVSSSKAYVYRYRVKEETTANTSQDIALTLVLGGAGAAKLADKHDAYDAALKDWRAATEAHGGVHVSVSFEDGTTGAQPLSDDHYVRYGEDFGREHMDVLQPVIDKLAAKLSADGHYPRVLETGAGEQQIRTNGGFAFVSRGFGYLPIYATDSRGNIAMGTGEMTLERLTPKAVTGYYLFYYLDTAAQGLDMYGADAEDYYTRRIAPLPYDPGGALHNVQLKPDGRPDGVGCVVKDGRLLKDNEL